MQAFRLENLNFNAVHWPRKYFRAIPSSLLHSGYPASHRMDSLVLLPSDLTRFRMSCCAGPKLQRHLLEPDPQSKPSAQEFDPAVAGCRLQGTAIPHLARQILSNIS